jgi:gas vesicle protein
MSTTELRHLINEQLAHIEDVAFLHAIKTIIESKASEGMYQLSDYQKSRIDSARKQLKDKQTIPHQELQKEIDQWLSLK